MCFRLKKKTPLHLLGPVSRTCAVSLWQVSAREDPPWYRFCLLPWDLLGSLLAFPHPSIAGSLFRGTYCILSVVQTSLCRLSIGWKQPSFWSEAFRAFPLSFLTYLSAGHIGFWFCPWTHHVFILLSYNVFWNKTTLLLIFKLSLLQWG